MLTRTVLLILMILPGLLFADDKKIWIAAEPQIAALIHPEKNWLSGSHENFLQVNESKLPIFSKKIHEHFKRCGGYRVLQSAPTPKDIQYQPHLFNDLLSVDYKINEPQNFFEMEEGLSETYMNKIVSKLSSYKTRYYKSREGIQALNWIAEEWKQLTIGRADITIEKFKHSNHEQPSIILTINGLENDKEIIILGGHADSINTDHESINAIAPGADDNAAGIAVLSVLIKTIVEHQYKPKKTIQFIAYAAEEVGIQGSYEIAKQYRLLNKNVIGVLQFDGVNYAGKNYDLALISDSTHLEQNHFLAELIDTYLHVPWTWDSCGYACSDHAAWNYEGYRASYPVEGIKKDQNPHIHTIRDTFAKSNFSTAHAKKFARLGLAYLVELDH